MISVSYFFFNAHCLLNISIHLLLDILNSKHAIFSLAGIGFKSVFLVTTRPYIFSNGYQIRLSEEPDLHCGIGYIVPEWVNGRPTVSDIHRVYGSHKVLPTTVIVLPLRPEKVQAVKKQLSGVHPELLLFLSKIRKLSIQENSKDPLDGVDVATAIYPMRLIWELRRTLMVTSASYIFLLRRGLIK